MDVVPVMLRRALLALERFETRISALQGGQGGARPLRWRMAIVCFTADHFSHRLNDAEGVVFGDNAFFDQVMDQAVK
jgi:hypothetical protein